MFRSWVPNRRQRARLLVLAVLTCMAWAALLTAVGHIQIVRGGLYADEANRQQVETLPVPARRGSILDRHGVLLATSGGRSDYHERAYPLGEVACHLVGFVGQDLQGLAGVEFSFDSLLAARPGEQVVFRDGRRHRRPIPGEILRSPTNGCNVRLTVDATYQCLLSRELRAGMRAVDAKRAWAVLIDPWTGDVLAMASFPAYDPARAVAPGRGLLYPERHYTNHAVSSLFEPGSSFKVITAAAALDSGLVSPGTVLDCGNGTHVIGNRTIHDIHPHGVLTFAEVLAYSSNVGIAQIAELLGHRRLFEKARLFGFGSKTGIALPGEAHGVLRDLSQWSDYSLVSISFGQEISVTAMQMVLAVGAVANGGMLMKPRLVTEVSTPSGQSIASYEPAEVRRVLSPASCVTLTKLLVGVVELGTGRRAGIRGLSVAGKTGTAQRFRDGAPDGYVSTFVGYAPAECPAFVLLVVVDDPQNEHLGGVVCAPIFRRVVLGMMTNPGGCVFPRLARAAAHGGQRSDYSVASAAGSLLTADVG